MLLVPRSYLTALILAGLCIPPTLQAADPPKGTALPEVIPDDAMPPKKLPKLSEVMSIAREYFTNRKGYESGDLLTSNDVKPLFRELQQAGWKVKAEKVILSRMHTNSDFLASQLSTPKGVKFMRKIAKMPGGYDRLDHLLKMPYGKRRIKEFIDSPGGYTMIEYMTTTQGGKNLGKYLSQTKTGKGFNQPTDMIYTQTELLQVIQETYQAENNPKGRRK
ncbi:hypothetical protein F1728_10205 [Gimesia benthica]|uniref:Uncharacterized protein n=1 Tax=Gimesia benthica TaxID=2608982 RepID=A0A6I6AAA5_9PLAN|nr:hypothetical protein [Gimesia benthica]QGQ23018.1 hypothetical protein F1728_10205 [Gimesia benthica]